MVQRAVRLSLEDAAKKADRKGIGYDAMVRYSYGFSDERSTISRIAGGERDGYSDEERRIIETGGEIGRKEGEDEQIPAGTYLFEQLPFIPEEKDLPRLILPYSSSSRRMSPSQSTEPSPSTGEAPLNSRKMVTRRPTSPLRSGLPNS